MTTGSVTAVLAELQQAANAARPLPFTVQCGPFALQIRDRVDLIMNIEGFRRLAAAEAVAGEVGIEGAEIR
jgi:hypothetical protein